MASERSGRRLYLVLAGITALVKLGALLPMMGMAPGGLGPIASVVLVASLVCLWRGSVWAQRLAAGAFVLSGCLKLLRFAYSLDALDLHGAGVVIPLVLGIVDLIAGLALLLRKDLNAFFRHQRAGGGDLKSAPYPRKQRMQAACLWGLVLAGGCTILLAAEWAQGFEFQVISKHEVGELIEVLLIGMGTACALGSVAGLAVGFVEPRAGMSTKRLTVKRGLFAAGTCVVAGIAGAAVYGGLFAPASAMFPTAPGLPRAALTALFFAIFGSPICAAAGFVSGVPIALLLNDEHGKKPADDWLE